METQFTFRRYDAGSAPEQTIQECATLFSQHYGRWSADHEDPKRRGQPIRMSPAKLKATYLNSKTSWLAVAYTDSSIAGYAIAQFIPHSNRLISWVVQLVVHADHRKKLVASRLLNSIWGHSDHAAWGIASANPYAIRALEKATRRWCSAKEICSDKNSKIVEKATGAVTYLNGKSTSLSGMQSVINTDFDQDFSQLDGILSRMKESGDRPWGLGSLPRGHEWLAMTFRSQPKQQLSQKEFLQFLATSSQITEQAYDRMPTDLHAWAKPEHAEREVQFLVDQWKLPEGARILDLGCGNGRHAIALGRRGYDVSGVDRSPAMIAKAIEHSRGLTSVQFAKADILTYQPASQFDAVICLYDVVGSYSDDAANLAILEKAIAAAKPGAMVAISVMSFDYMSTKATKVANGDAERFLGDLEPSTGMETQGNVFDPDRMVLDKTLKLVFRKERFSRGDDLPEELLVVDRRYGLEELRNLCQARMDVLAIGHVTVGHFELVDLAGEPTKEILVLGRKRLA